MTAFDHSIWLNAQEEKKKRREDFRQATLHDVDRALKELSKKYVWASLYIFGSLLRPGMFGRDSDVDIAVKGLRKTDYYAFVAEFSNLLGRDADVVNLEECGFGETIVSRGLKWKPKED